MTVIGSTIGMIAALGAGRFAESLLFRLNGHDPRARRFSLLILVCIAFGPAGFIPALRASRVDPIRAL